MTISWLLHLHQPAIQDEGIVINISNSSYRPLLGILRDNSNFKVTLSISGTLIEWWQKLGMTDILETLSLLVNRGQVEIVGTGFCHPILTLLPREESVRQIQLEEELLQRLVSGFSVIPANAGIQRNDTGSSGQARGHCKSLGSPSADGSPRCLRGFFSPEMAISNDLIKTLSEQSYEWVMIDEVAALGRPHLLSVNNMPTKVVVRDRGASLAVAFGYAQTLPIFTNLVDNYARFSDRLVLAMDEETFGHHWPASLSLLSDLAKSTVFNWHTVSESIADKTASNVANVQESTWGTSDEDLVDGVLYPKWKLENNAVHKLQWELTELAITSVGVGRDRPVNPVSSGDPRVTPTNTGRELLDHALGSDQFWWASKNPYWNPGMVKKGAEMLLRVVELAKPSSQQANEAKELYTKIIYALG